MEHLGHTKLITCFSDQAGLFFSKLTKKKKKKKYKLVHMVGVASIVGNPRVVYQLWALIGILLLQW